MRHPRGAREHTTGEGENGFTYHEGQLSNGGDSLDTTLNILSDLQWTDNAEFSWTHATRAASQNLDWPKIYVADPVSGIGVNRRPILAGYENSTTGAVLRWTATQAETIRITGTLQHGQSSSSPSGAGNPLHALIFVGGEAVAILCSRRTTPH